MTNKTIALSREAILLVAREMDRLGYGHHESHAESLLYAALEADPVPPSCYKCGKPTACGKMICEECCYEPLPVPPAGGKPDPIIAVLKGHLADGMNPMFSGGDLKHLIGLLEAVTRLKAEVERLKDDVLSLGCIVDECGKERVVLQSELTKARELLTFVVNSGGFSYATVAKDIREFLSNQSAPADKGQGEPVCSCPSGDGSLRHPCMIHHEHEWDINDQGTATVCSVCGVRSSDEPPAPVAVVMPERLTSAELEELEVIEVLLHGQGLSNLAGTMAAARQFIEEIACSAASTSRAVVLPERKPVEAIDFNWTTEDVENTGWNACLDEFARLNLEPKP